MARKDKISKPFYKRIWFWIVIVIVLIVAFGGIGSKNDQSTKTSSSSSSKVSSSSSSSSSTTNNSDNKATWTKSDFDSVAVGDLASNGQGGANYNDIVSKFGEPSSKSDSSTNGQTTTIATWDKAKGGYSSVVITFLGTDPSSMVVTSKSISNLSMFSNAKKWTMNDFNAVTAGQTTLDSLTKTHGIPSSSTVTYIMGNEQTTAIWTNGNGGIGSGVTITFNNGDGTANDDKTQTDLK